MARKRSSRSTNASKEEAPAAFSLDGLREKVERTRQLADWMGAAFEHRDEFPAQVVVTVVGDYLRQYDEIVDGLREAATGASEERSRLADSASSLEDAAKELEAQIDELKLRHVIGELTQEEFDEKEAEARKDSETDALPKTRDAMEEIDSVLAEVGAVQARIAEMRRNHEALVSGDEPAPAPEPEPEPAPAPEPEAPPAPEPEAEPAGASPGPDDLGDAAYAAGGGANEEWDVASSSPPAETLPDPAPAPAPQGAESISATGEDLMATGVISARPDMGDSAPPVQAAEQIAPPATAPGEGPRLMVTPPDGAEQMYPFTGEVMSMGRGRNNDIQIKNDGKISRYHCRIFRRGDEFIIEDNKSSNGTLVNGKLVTRQRLDGGEQVQIGETRMTFHL